MNKIFEELSEATGSVTTGLVTKPAETGSRNGGSAAAVAGNNSAMDEFLKFNETGAASSASPAAAGIREEEQVVSKEIEQPKKTWYANKDGFISAEMPTDLFDEQSQSSTGAGALVVAGMQDANVNPTLSEDLTKKIKQEAEESKKPKKFNGAHLQLARLPSNSGDVFSLNTPEDFTMHLESVQSDLNALKGLLVTNDQYSYDPSNLTGVSVIGDCI